MKKIISTFALVALSFTVLSATAYAKGDPTDQETTGVQELTTLPENPQPTEPVREDDHTPISYDGTGTIVDNILNGSKQFYTISTDAGNVFYLIIDLDKENNNVYFLDTTKERDLIALAEEAEDDGITMIEPQPLPQSSEPEEPEEPDEPAPKAPVQKSSNASFWVIMFLIVIAGAVVGFYYMVYKPKKDAEEAEEFEEAYSFEDDNKESSYDDDNAYD